MPTGAALHFPAGSYYEQIATDQGKEELDLMQVSWRMWYLKEQLSLDKYDRADMDFIRWIESNHTDKLAQIVAMMWHDNT